MSSGGGGPGVLKMVNTPRHRRFGFALDSALVLLVWRFSYLLSTVAAWQHETVSRYVQRPSFGSPARSYLPRPSFSSKSSSSVVLRMGLFDDPVEWFKRGIEVFQDDREVEAHHILRKATSPAQVDEAMAELETLKTEIMAEKSLKEDQFEAFSEAAARLSDCPSSSKGGNLGRFKRGVMVPRFDDTVWNIFPSSRPRLFSMPESYFCACIGIFLSLHTLLCASNANRRHSTALSEQFLGLFLQSLGYI